MGHGVSSTANYCDSGMRRIGHIDAGTNDYYSHNRTRGYDRSAQRVSQPHCPTDANCQPIRPTDANCEPHRTTDANREPIRPTDANCEPHCTTDANREPNCSADSFCDPNYLVRRGKGDR